MWANSVWGLFGLSASCVLTMLGLSPDSPWQSLLLIGAALFAVGSAGVLSWPLHVRANRVRIAALIVHPAKAIRLIEPSHIIILGLAVALGGVIWQMRREPVKPSAVPQAAQSTVPQADVKSSTQVTIEAVKIPAPYYTKTDVDRILEALFEISNLIGKSTKPLEESADNCLRKWSETLLASGEPEFRSQAKQLRLKVEAIEKGSWDIINNNQHYTKELAPIFLDRAPVQKFLEKLRAFVQAGETLGPSIDQRTLTLLEPMRNETVRTYADLRKWLSDVADKASQETARFRAMTQKAEK